MVLITSIVGSVLVIVFLGFLAVWIKAPPLIAIIVIVVALLIYDVWQEIRAENNKT